MKLFFQTNYKKIVLSIIALCALLFIISLIQIAQGNITGFQPLVYGFGALLFGAFNWADVSIFSLLWLIISVVLLRLKEKEYFWIAYFAFWFIRGIGEMMFSFLQQFHPETKPWAVYLPRAVMQHSFLGQFVLARYWVIEQIVFQSIAVLSLFGLVYAVATLMTRKLKAFKT